MSRRVQNRPFGVGRPLVGGHLIFENHVRLGRNRGLDEKRSSWNERTLPWASSGETSGGLARAPCPCRGLDLLPASPCPGLAPYPYPARCPSRGDYPGPCPCGCPCRRPSSSLYSCPSCPHSLGLDPFDLILRETNLKRGRRRSVVVWMRWEETANAPLSSREVRRGRRKVQRI